jgi:uncharacterized protein YraI
LWVTVSFAVKLSTFNQNKELKMKKQVMGAIALGALMLAPVAGYAQSTPQNTAGRYGWQA